MIVFVMSFAPDVTDTTGEGGFEWRYKRTDAIKELTRHLCDGTEGFDYMLRAVAIPDNLDNEGITRHLEERADLWDVPAVTPFIPDPPEITS